MFFLVVFTTPSRKIKDKITVKGSENEVLKMCVFVHNGSCQMCLENVLIFQTVSIHFQGVSHLKNHRKLMIIVRTYFSNSVFCLPILKRGFNKAIKSC